jgi:hypothetical protein
MFASRYLEINRVPACIETLPHRETGIIIVIPCLKEFEITKTLQSLYNCNSPKCFVEVIILINHSQKSSDDLKKMNLLSKEITDKWINSKESGRINFFSAGPVELPAKWAGAGMARKKGMDEAVRRFNILSRPGGIIVSLDADTVVEKNYLKVIEEHFNNYPDDAGATITFSHPKEGLSDKHLQGITLYEKYMIYYKRALAFTGFPHPMFTVGSAFAVRAEAYVKRGGMNRRQAGEDFYFLQNLVDIGRVGEISETTVHPSARLSDRVPFGTGPILQKWIEDKEDLTKTYNFSAFEDLRKFFDMKDRLFRISAYLYPGFLEELPVSVSAFLEKDGFREKIWDLNKNCSNLRVFQKRFYQKFNAFKILKYMNFVHEKYYGKAELNKQIYRLEQNSNK